MDYKTLASREIVEKTIESLKKNNISADFVQTSEEAKRKVLSMIPKGAEVMNMTSRTLDATGIAQEITESGKYNSVRQKLNSMNRETQGLEMQKLGAAPEWTVGSVHAVTQNGKVLIASNTGSQLPAYAYGSPHVIWVVGTQKIVKDLDDGMKRIYKYVLPLESERLNKAYNINTGSFVSKLLIFSRESPFTPNRTHIIFVNEALGF